MIAKLKEMLDRVQDWPPEAQEEAMETLLAIEQDFGNRSELSDEDRAAIARSAEDVRLARFATDQAIEAVFARYRRE
jgi:hypothetical protein